MAMPRVPERIYLGLFLVDIAGPGRYILVVRDRADKKQPYGLPCVMLDALADPADAAQYLFQEVLGLGSCVPLHAHAMCEIDGVLCGSYVGQLGPLYRTLLAASPQHEMAAAEVGHLLKVNPGFLGPYGALVA